MFGAYSIENNKIKFENLNEGIDNDAERIKKLEEIKKILQDDAENVQLEDFLDADSRQLILDLVDQELEKNHAEAQELSGEMEKKESELETIREENIQMMEAAIAQKKAIEVSQELLNGLGLDNAVEKGIDKLAEDYMQTLGLDTEVAEWLKKLYELAERLRNL